MKLRTEVAVGDEIQFYPRDFRSHHAATCIVTKVKRRTFDCVERKGSYRAGKQWNIHMESDFCYVWQESDGRWRFSRTTG
jgi:hypothetical protein